eukprot:SAG11_NODE_459_length_9261_cov_7.747463_13_plen_105_part_00
MPWSVECILQSVTTIGQSASDVSGVDFAQVWVVDSTDRRNLRTCRDEMLGMLGALVYNFLQTSETFRDCALDSKSLLALPQTRLRCARWCLPLGVREQIGHGNE